MAKITESQIKTAKREEILQKLLEFLQSQGEDVGYCNGNSLNFPWADRGVEGWIKIVCSCPTGGRGEEYDGYGEREEFELLAAKRKAEKEEAEAKKKKKATDRRIKQEALEQRKAEEQANLEELREKYGKQKEANENEN